MSDKILKLSQAQTLYSDLRERIDALPTSEDIPEVPVQDVQVNGTSVLENGVAVLPFIAKEASVANVKAGTWASVYISPAKSHLSTFYGLSKAAGVDLANETVTFGTYPETSKVAIRTMLGAGTYNKPSGGIPSSDLAETYLTEHQSLSNYVQKTDYADASNYGLVKVETSLNNNGIYVDSLGKLKVSGAVELNVKKGSLDARPIVPSVQHISTFYGLSKVAGVDLANETVTLGTYPETSKTAIRSMLGATSSNVIAVQDTQPTDTDTKIWLPETAETPVQIPTMEDLGDYVQKTDIATSSTPGIVKVNSRNGITIDSNGVLKIEPAGGAIKTGASDVFPITPKYQHMSVFYGLAKAAGDTTQSVSSNAVGTYTDEAKTAIRNMIGAGTSNITDAIIGLGTASETSIVNNNIIRFSTAFKVNTGGELGLNNPAESTIKNTLGSWGITPSVQHMAVFYGLAKAAGDTTQAASSNTVGTYTNEAAVAIRNMLGAVGTNDVATATAYGLVKVDRNSNAVEFNNGALNVVAAGVDNCKGGSTKIRVLTPYYQHCATFYGLAKAAGDTTQAISDNAVGTYTTEAAAAIRSMLGAISATDYASSSNTGVVKIPSSDTSGLKIAGSTGALAIQRAYRSDMRIGTNEYRPITSYNVGDATFIGLVRAAGGTITQSDSETTWTYTNAQKSAIQQMLGIDLASIASEVEIPLVETVSGASVTISGQPNTRYMCGEVTSISITPPASGTIDVVFTSGSTVAILTLPSTVKMPEWFDATTLDTNTIYEILITDGIYGSVMTWAT